MNYPRIFFILGLLIILVPFIGVPLVVKYGILMIFGATNLFFAALLRSSQKKIKAQATRSVVKKRVTPRARPSRSLRALQTNDTELPQESESLKHEVSHEEEYDTSRLIIHNDEA